MKYKALASLTDEDTRGAFLLEAFAPEDIATLKQKALDLMGIARADGESHLDAYLRYLAEINGLPVMKPAHPDIADMCGGNRDIARTLWFLA